MITREIETNGPNSWIHVMSRNQSLTVPSKEAAFQCIKSEKCFERFHGVGLKVKDPFNRLSSLILKKYPDFNAELVRKFVKVRTYAR